MSGSRVLWGQITIVVVIVLAAIWGATEWTAWRLGFQGQLGSPWFEMGGWPIYYPPLFFWWWYSYDAYAPGIFVEGAIIAASGGFLSIAVAITLSIIRAREAKNVATYGSARWASPEEVTAAGLLGPDGVVLGRLDRDYLRHDGPEHVLCFAPTRSGKGVGLVVPTLLTWPGSVIVHDIKGENWGLTAGFRARHGRVLLFDPTDAKSSAYNPLLEVRRGDWEVRDVQNIADILVDPEGALDKRNHWEKTSHSLLVGVILHVLYAEPDKTLAGVANFLSDPKRPMEATLRAMMSTPHLGEAGVHPVIASSARELLNKSDNERSGVLSTAMSFLGLYRDPVVARVTVRCDWRIADLVSGKRPVSLYLVVPPSDIARTKPLIRLILNQVGRRLTEELNAANRHRLLLMLDEFPALGRLDFFESALAFMAGYGIKSFLIAQSLNQIEKAYGANNGERIVRLVAHHVGAEVHAGAPRVSAELPETGERFEGLLPPVVSAPAFAIRKPAVAVFTLADYVAAGIMSAEQAEALRSAVTARANILVAGGTSTGKTTLTNALLAEVAKTADRVVIIEDTRELQCAAPNLVALRTKDGVASLSDLVRSSLRLRPDRIPIGEVRGPEALDLLKAWGTGHPGGVGTIHAGSAIGAIRRLEQLIQEAVVTVPRALIAETIDLVAVLAGRGSQRRLVELARVEGLGLDGDYRVVPAVSDGGDIQPVLDLEPTGELR